MMTPEDQNVQCVPLVDAMRREHRRFLQPGHGGRRNGFRREPAALRPPIGMHGRAEVAEEPPAPDRVAACETRNDDVPKPHGDPIDSVAATYL